MASTPAVIMTAPPTKVRRKASLRARMRSAVVTVVLVIGFGFLRLRGWGGARRFGNAWNEEGRPEGRPDASAKIVISATPLPLARNVERGVQDSDVLPLDLQGRRSWIVGPANDEVGL